jgi:hypothetical protein
MVAVINPKVDVISYGPVLKVKNEEGKEIEITPDEFVYGAASITYKNTGALKELIDMKMNDIDISKKVKKMLIKVGSAGHASMATTPGFWGFIEGDSSKFVDSIFTTAVFGSSLMPSGRRVPITKEAIVIPKMIADKGEELTNLYLKQSEANINAYEVLMNERGVPKEEAAKIVQYGHKGGGFMFMPLETLIHFSKLSERDPEAMPEEGKEVISQLESFIKTHGMGVTYEARKQAPRTGCVHPNIFRDVKGNNMNYAEEILGTTKENHFDNPLDSPQLITSNIKRSPELERRLDNYFKKREAIFSNTELVKNDWKNILGELEEIVGNFNSTVDIRIASNIPWRVWGEVKRHRTLSQDTESIYHAVNRAIDVAFDEDLGGETPDYWKQVLSIPSSIEKDSENFKMWTKEFSNSLNVYKKLVDAGVKESEALAIIPRGIKMMNVKNYDLYNLTTGYISLRLCGTAESEMRAITEREAKIVKEVLPYPSLISPKCNYVGFCPELDYQGGKCRKVNQKIKNYDETMHKDLQSARIKGIEERCLFK